MHNVLVNKLTQEKRAAIIATLVEGNSVNFDGPYLSRQQGDGFSFARGR